MQNSPAIISVGRTKFGEHYGKEPEKLIEEAWLGHDDELIPVRAHGPVVVQPVADLRITANHVGRLDDDARDRVVYPAAISRDLAPRVC